jgi:beta-lactamase class A
MKPELISIQRIIDQFRSEESVISVSARFPDRTEFHFNPDHVLHPASTIKVALLVSVMRMVEEGLLTTKETVAVRNEFASLVPGERYAVDPEGDSDPGIYAYLGRRLSVWNLALRMIRVSSNLATNLLLDRVGAARVNEDLAAIGVKGLQFLRGMDDTPAFERGLINQGTSRGLMQLAGAIQDDRAASRRSCYLIRQAMFLTQHEWGLAKAATDGWGVAHKPGWITGHYHDFGMLYAPDATPLVLAVMTKRATAPDAREAVAEIAREARSLVRPT